MQRISTLTKTLNLFGLGKHGFKNGDLATGILPTDLDAAWCNGIQEEVVAVIEAAGIELSGASLAQLLLALRSAGVFQTAALGDSGTKAATTAFANPGSSLSTNGYQRLPSGLIIQWGTNLSNVTIGVGQPITFPLTFPTGVLNASATALFGGNVYANVASVNPPGMSIFASASVSNVYWFAIGY